MEMGCICDREGTGVKLVGVDVEDTLLTEAKQRSEQVTRKYGNSVNYKFQSCDLCFSDNISSSPVPDAFVADVISCQFALHYFFKSETTFTNFFKLVAKHLKKGGIFITSQFDGEKVVQELEKQTFNQPNLYFSIKAEAPVEQLSEFGFPISVVLQGDDDVILKNATVEYLVFPQKFISRMEKMGFLLIDSKGFDESGLTCSDMSGSEHIYSNLHRYYTFVYEPHKRDDNQAIVEQISSMTLADDDQRKDIQEVEPEEEQDAQEEQQQQKQQEDFSDDKWTIKTLRDYAKANDIKIPSSARKKAEIIKILSEMC